jgi:Bacterial Ig-like domain
MRRSLVRLALGLTALGALCSVTLGRTYSAYSATATVASNTFAAAPDWTAPTASSAPIGRTSAYDMGFIKQGTSYYVYANVTDSGSPASGIAAVTANVGTITAGSSAVALTSGSYSAGGSTYDYRSATLTAGSSLAAGSYTYTVSSTDKAGNTATQSFTTAIDNTPPTAIDVQSTNVSGGTVGHFDAGDTLVLTYSGVIDPYSVLSGWTGAATNVQVALVDGGGSSSDSVYVYNTAASPVQIPVGIVTLGASDYLNSGAGNYVTFGANGAATPSTMVQLGTKITITLGTPSATTLRSTSAAAMTWAPSTAATDIAGNAVTGASATQSGALHVNF